MSVSCSQPHQISCTLVPILLILWVRKLYCKVKTIINKFFLSIELVISLDCVWLLRTNFLRLIKVRRCVTMESKRMSRLYVKFRLNSLYFIFSFFMAFTYSMFNLLENLRIFVFTNKTQFSPPLTHHTPHSSPSPPVGFFKFLV